jgi:hypothetical protein
MAIARTGVYVDDYLECETYAPPISRIIEFATPSYCSSVPVYFVFGIV